MIEWLVEWWDGVELWLVRLPYPLLVTLVLAVLVPLCWGLAWILDRGIDWIGAKLTRVGDAEPPVSKRDAVDNPGRTT
ncbi:hypothetical protein [Parasphingorhabdus pacifica]